MGDYDEPHGLTWEEFSVGRTFKTLRRTVTEADLVSFVTSMGLFEELFISDLHGARRLCPGAMTYAMAEGLVVQTQTLQRTGLAFLETSLVVHRPVYVGDTIQVHVEVIHARPTSDGGRGVVTTRNVVRNQDDVAVLTYEPIRLVKGGKPA